MTPEKKRKTKKGLFPRPGLGHSGMAKQAMLVDYGSRDKSCWLDCERIGPKHRDELSTYWIWIGFPAF